MEGYSVIRIHLSALLGKLRMTQSELAKKSGIRSNTINMYYHEYIRRINVEDINRICKALNCRIDELIEYIPDEKK